MNELCRILIKGGVLSPSELKQITDLVTECGLDYIHFGSRQDILFPKTPQLEVVDPKFPQFDVEELSKKQYQNIMSSYASADVFSSVSWLTGTTYLNVLGQFRYKPTLEINITDPQQRLVPLFTGNLNFIASKQMDYWYLHLDLPDYESKDYYPALIHTWDIATIAQAIEENFEDFDDLEGLFQFISRSVDTNNRTIAESLSIPFYPFPYYEGMNRMGMNNYWLGLYWRNNKYDIAFLKAMCDLCLESKVGKICLTPWKSFIIKGIPRADKLKWEKFLGSWGINVRHSSLELNWHLPVNDTEALELKKFLVRNFDQNDISTYGLTFAINSAYSKKFTSIVIERNPKPQIAKDFDIRPTYNVQFGNHFDPNSLHYKTYVQDVDKIELPGILMELSRLYFEQLNENTERQETLNIQKSPAPKPISNVHQCEHCLTIYDPRYGDPFNNIPVSTPFENLPLSYVCPTCEAPLSSFQPKTMIDSIPISS
ncbi:MAG: rubredoxin [Bacteroidota bacterium]